MVDSLGCPLNSNGMEVGSFIAALDRMLFRALSLEQKYQEYGKRVSS